jgi:hypothetical protein
MPKKESLDVVVEPKEPTTLETAIVPSDVSPVYLKITEPAALKKELKRQLEVRKVYAQIIKDYLIEGIDYGPIHIAKNCPHKYNVEACKTPAHWSKKNLFKSGSEKIIGLFKLRAEFHKDEDTSSMMASVKDAAFYVCKLIYIPSGEIVTEGRGACSLKEKYDNVNNAIKIAQKRAKTDAVLSLGFSDSFTQDLEDEDQIESRATTVVSSSSPAASEVTEADRKATFLKALKGRLDQYPPEERIKHRTDTIARTLAVRKEFTKEELEAAL